MNVDRHLVIMSSMNNYDATKFGEQKKTRRGAFLLCETCKREFYVNPSRLQRAVKVRFCSMKCYDKTGDKNPFWGMEHSLSTRAKMVGQPSRADSGKRLAGWNIARWAGVIGPKKMSSVIEEAGKCARCSFDDIRILQLHHKDRNRRNNQRDNLEVICPNCHALEHYVANDGMYRLKVSSGTCRKGHELTGNNVRTYKGRSGKLQKICRTCERDRARLLRASARRRTNNAA